MSLHYSPDWKPKDVNVVCLSQNYLLQRIVFLRQINDVLCVVFIDVMCIL